MGGRAFSGVGLQAMLEDDRVWCVGARVEAHRGEADHYRVNDDGDLEVDVVTHQGQEITALLGGIVGGNGRGTWRAPSVGTEGAVVFLDGDFEGDAVFLGGMSSKNVPDGVSDDRTLIVDGEIELKADDLVEFDAPEVRIGGGSGHQSTFKAAAFLTEFATLIGAIGTAVGTSGTPADFLAAPSTQLFLTTVAKVK
jgi:hypothetical protein